MSTFPPIPPLSDEELFTFDRAGFAVVRNAFPPTQVRTLAARLELLERAGPACLPAGCHPVRTPVVDELRLLNLVEAHDEFLELVDHPALLRWVRALVPHPQRVTESFSITRRRGPGLPLHQIPIAESTNEGGRPRTKFLTFLLALSEVGAQDGPLVVFEGTHHVRVPFPYNLLHAGWDMPPHDLAAVQTTRRADEGRIARVWEEIPGYREVHVAPGDMVVMTQDLVHGAKAVTSDRTRRTLVLSYSPYHFSGWHGVEPSARLLARATPERRRLLAGPFVGSLHPGLAPPWIEPSADFPLLVETERENAPDPRAPGPDTREVRALLLLNARRRTSRATAESGRNGALPARGVCQLEVSGCEHFALALDDGTDGIRLIDGEDARAEAHLQIELQDLEDLVHGRADPVELFYRGRAQVRGNRRLAMSLADLWCGPTPPPCYPPSS